MKKIAILTFSAILTICLLFACTPNTGVVDTATETVISVSAKVVKDLDGKTLEDYMNELVKKEYLTYEAKDGMIVTINGKEADASKNEYWLIYTDYAEYANEAWGTYDYDGKKFGSATLGIKEFPVKDGITIVFAISKF